MQRPLFPDPSALISVWHFFHVILLFWNAEFFGGPGTKVSHLAALRAERAKAGFRRPFHRGAAARAVDDAFDAHAETAIADLKVTER